MADEHRADLVSGQPEPGSDQAWQVNPAHWRPPSAASVAGSPSYDAGLAGEYGIDPVEPQTTSFVHWLAAAGVAADTEAAAHEAVAFMNATYEERAADDAAELSDGWVDE